MRHVLVFMGLLLVGLLQAMRLHFPFFNGKGSPNPASPYQIDHPEMSKAIYGRLDEVEKMAFFNFKASAGFNPMLVLLIPSPAYKNKGLRVTMRVFGPGLPEEGAASIPSERFMTIVGNEYAMVQSYMGALPQDNEYKVVLEQVAGSGTYCLCMGTGESHDIPKSLFERVDAYIAQDNQAS